MAIPRAVGRLLVYLLDVFEGIMLTILWEYQGENILQFLYEHRHLAHNPVATHRQNRHRSLSTQTDDAATGEFAEEQQQQLKRQVTRDRIIEELVPELLKTLNKVPKTGDVEQVLSKQLAVPAKALEQQLEQLADLQQSVKSCADSNAGMELAVQALGDTVNTINEYFRQAVDALEADWTIARDIGDQVATLSDSIMSVKLDNNIHAATLERLVQDVAQLDARLSEDISAKQSAPQLVDVAVNTADLHAVSSTATVRTVNEPNNTAWSPSLAANRRPDIAAPSSSCSDSGDSHSDATVDRIHALTALKELAPKAELDTQHESQLSSTKSHRFSLRREFKRRSLFGKRPA
ncbi:hypothetical protein H4S02_006206 [Coemansia sp. RSA 2611]|nr:hypothetical protein H4S02_006206 [Coemansia sp. RSA 2611]